MTDSDKVFPKGMEPLGHSKFTFACHPGVPCFTTCCRDVDLTLYPYDVIKLKNSLDLDSEVFMREHCFLVHGDNPFFPTVKLKLSEDKDKSCPFLTDQGCSVYKDRPTACRTYPLERAVDRTAGKRVSAEYYFMTSHPYCLGHREDKEFTVDKWLRNQQLHEYNTMNTLWVAIDSLFGSNPWKGEGAAGERQQLAFMVCYNIDGFRRFCDVHRLVKQFKLESHVKKRIGSDDGELLKFGFEWLKVIFTGKSSLVKR